MVIDHPGMASTPRCVLAAAQLPGHTRCPGRRWITGHGRRNATGAFGSHVGRAFEVSHRIPCLPFFVVHLLPSTLDRF